MSAPTSITPVLLDHYEELVSYIQARFSRQDFARDVIHEVCEQLLRQPPQMEVRQPLAFLRKISLNRALDVCRARKIHEASHVYGQELPEHPHNEDGAYHLQFEQSLRTLVALIEKLPARQRQCFLLHRVHGMEQHEIAEQIGLSRNAVSQHVRFATQRIAQRWEPARQYFQTQRQRAKLQQAPTNGSLSTATRLPVEAATLTGGDCAP